MKEKSNIQSGSYSPDRIIGRYKGNNQGPTVICIAGLHGNEPAGMQALKEVFTLLEQERPPFRGELIGITGNLKAIAAGVRFIEDDLNRMWRPGVIERLISEGDTKDPQYERTERQELINVLVEICRNRSTPVYFIDLHTTSAEGSPFITIADTLRNRRFTDNFPVPRILGIEEQLDSTLLNYINEFGYIAVGFEAGQHQAKSSIDNCVASVWIMIANAGLINLSDLRMTRDPFNLLKKASADRCGVYEVRYRECVTPDEGFSMAPGFTNFQRIKKSQLLAHNKYGEIRSPEGGYIFMPLYQKQGDDGFFVIRAINPLWLGLSVILRKIRMDRVLPFLPGFKAGSDRTGTLMVDLRVAKWYVIEFLHLLGYRRKFSDHGMLYASRRKFDIEEPHDYRFPLNAL